MTSIEDKIRNYMKGDVRGKWVSRDGREISCIDTHNTISFDAASAVAAAYGGDVSKVPKFVGFLYGDLANPTGLTDPENRNMQWDDIREEVRNIKYGNIQVAKFSFAPTFSTPDEDDSDSNGTVLYKNNAVTFHACTRSGSAGKYAFPTDGGSGYAEEFKDGMYIYHALLLSPKTECECDPQEYNVLARVSLDRNKVFRKKPEDYELALDWCVTFF